MIHRSSEPIKHLSNREGTYYYRRRINSRYRPIFNVKYELRVSLGTKDRSEAMRGLQEMNHWVENKILEFERTIAAKTIGTLVLPATPDNISGFCAAYRYANIRGVEENVILHGVPEDRDDLITEKAAALDLLSEANIKRDINVTRNTLSLFEMLLRVQIGMDDDSRKRLEYAFLREAKLTQEGVIAALSGKQLPPTDLDPVAKAILLTRQWNS